MIYPTPIQPLDDIMVRFCGDRSKKNRITFLRQSGFVKSLCRPRATMFFSGKGVIVLKNHKVPDMGL